MYLHRAAFSISYSKHLALLELAAFSLLLSLSIRRILQVYVGIQAAVCTGAAAQHTDGMELMGWVFYGFDYCFYKSNQLPPPSLLWLFSWSLL